MPNCHVMSLLGLYTALLADAVRVFPDLGGECQRDLIRLHELAKNRGIHAFCVDLPALAKHLDRCLAMGAYIPSGLPSSKAVSSRVVIPKLFRGLYLRIFDGQSGNLRCDDIEAIRLLRQLLMVAKKLDMECSEDKVSAAIADFLLDDQTIPPAPDYWGGFGPDNFMLRGMIPSFRELVSSEKLSLDSKQAVVLDHVSGIICSELGLYDPLAWSHRHGPGAISQSTTKVNKYGFAYGWSHRLDGMFPISDHGYYSHSSWASEIDVTGSDTPMNAIFKNRVCWGEGECHSQEEPSSRLISVPKTFKGPRLIAAEPVEHMWCQQNLWHYFRERSELSLVGKFIRFTDQTQNQELCLKGSTDGSLATVDLSAASDRVCCDVVGSLFRANPTLIAALRATRTRQVIMPDGSTHVLNKFSTMGSACTFPVESIVFLMLAISAHFIVSGEKPSKRGIEELVGSITVFGDDIILPVKDLQELRNLLKATRFKVNESKTFGIGMFRESCGVDAYRGNEVTSIYVRNLVANSPEEIVSIVETHNSFRKAGFVAVSKYLASLVSGRCDRVVAGSTVFGLETDVESLHVLGRKIRYNEDFQRVEVKHRVSNNDVTRTPTNDDSSLLQYFTEKPLPETKWVHGYSSRPTSKIDRRWVDINEIFCPKDAC